MSLDRRIGAFIIRRRVYRLAYPRNGNVGMTNTNRYCYDVLASDGRLLVPSVPTLREAKVIVARRS